MTHQEGVVTARA